MADPIVVGVDTSADSRTALAKAAELAEKAGAVLVAVHVRHEPSLAAIGEAAGEAVAMDSTLDEIEAIARQAVAQVMAGGSVAWRFEVGAGDPATELVRIAIEEQAGAIVVGGRGHGVVGGLVVGSVAQKLIRKSPVTVLVVRDHETHRIKDLPRSEAASRP